MNSSPANIPFATQLLQQDEPLSDSEYKEYRMKLESALTTAERRQKLAGRVAWITFAVTIALMFAGGTRILGDFDPWSKDATFMSVALGVTYILAIVICAVSLASYYSRFWPRVRDVKEQLRDARILVLQGELAKLRKEIAMISRRNEPE